MNSIGPGDLVQCVDASNVNPFVRPLSQGRVYRVRHLDRCECGSVSLRLYGLTNSPCHCFCTDCGDHKTAVEPSYKTERFRPVDHHPEFTEWLECLHERETV